MKEFISKWTVRLEFVNRYKNLFIVFIQVTTFCGVFGVTLKKSLVISVVMMVFYFLVAYVVDKTGLRNRVEKAGFDRNDAWLEMMIRLESIEKKLQKHD